MILNWMMNSPCSRTICLLKGPRNPSLASWWSPKGQEKFKKPSKESISQSKNLDPFQHSMKRRRATLMQATTLCSQGYQQSLIQIIDCYTHLNSDYHTIWSIFGTASRTASSSGVTTLIDMPMMNQNPTKSDPLDDLKRRVRILENSKIWTDVALMSHLQFFDDRTLSLLMAHECFFGFQAYLTPPYQFGLPYLSQEQFTEMLIKLHKTSKKFALAVYCEVIKDRELTAASPYRLQPLEKRLGHGIDIDLRMQKDGYADGENATNLGLTNSQISNFENDSDEDSLQEEERLMIQRHRKSGSKSKSIERRKVSGDTASRGFKRSKRQQSSPIGDKTPNSSTIKKMSLENNKLEGLRSLANMEIMSYNSESSQLSSAKTKIKKSGIESPRFPVSSGGEDDGNNSDNNQDSDSPTLQGVNPNSLNFPTALNNELKGNPYELGGERLSERAPPKTRSTVKEKGNVNIQHKRENSFQDSMKGSLQVLTPLIPTRKAPRMKGMYTSQNQNDGEDGVIKSHQKFKGKYMSDFKPPKTSIQDAKLRSGDNEKESIFSSVLKRYSRKTSTSTSLLERRKNFKGEIKISLKQEKGNEKEIETMRYEYNYFLGSRPDTWQNMAAKAVISALKQTPNPKFTTSLLNVSSSTLISLLREYNIKKKTRRVHPIVTTPHLYFCAEKVPKGATSLKFGQPIRGRKNRKFLLLHHRIKSISCVASGHMYVPKYLKNIDNGCFIKNFNGKPHISKKRFLFNRVKYLGSLDAAYPAKGKSPACKKLQLKLQLL